MTDKELKKLKRSDLLEMLIEQTKNVELLKAELKEAEEKLNSREITIDKAGSVAEAAVELSGIFNAAQDAASQYLTNIEKMSGEQEQICLEMEQKSREKAKAMIEAAEKKCTELERATKEKCIEMLKEAKEESESYWDEINERIERFYNDYKEMQDIISKHIKKESQD